MFFFGRTRVLFNNFILSLKHEIPWHVHVFVFICGEFPHTLCCCVAENNEAVFFICVFCLFARVSLSCSVFALDGKNVSFQMISSVNCCITILFPQNVRQLCRPENKAHNASKQPEQFPLNPDNTLTTANEYKASGGVEMESQM